MNKYCIHGTTVKYHPNCFRPKPWYNDLRVGYLDIEASGLEANKAWMLSWAIKERGKPNLIEKHVNYNDIFKSKGVVNIDYDWYLTKSLIENMETFDVLVGYYSTGFDIPFIRSRAMYHGLKFPSYGSIKHIDLFYHVRSKMCLSRNSLAVATAFLNITGKTHLDFSYWGLAGMGDTKAMKELITHNKQDVLILEKLHSELEDYCKFTKRSV